MKLQQLRYIAGVARRDLNISAAAEALYTSQPGVSKQIRLLEEELGVQIFTRNGKHLTDITPTGKRILEHADHILREVDNIKQAAEEFKDPNRGSLTIATTHTQARYALPPVIQQFRERYPAVGLHIHQGTPLQIAELTVSGKADIAIATEAIELFEDLVMMPCYKWNRGVVLTANHPLLQESKISLEGLARYPIATYVFGFTGRSTLDQAFHHKGLNPNVVFTATDAEVIKTYVRLGVGVGIIANMAYDPEHDQDLTLVDASHLFDASVTNIGFNQNVFLRGYVYDFIKLFAPHLTRETISNASQARTKEQQDLLWKAFMPNLLTR